MCERMEEKGGDRRGRGEEVGDTRHKTRYVYSGRKTQIMSYSITWASCDILTMPILILMFTVQPNANGAHHAQ